MNARRLKVAALALVAVPMFLFASSCATECVDYADCAAKAKAAKQEFTCIDGTCKAGSPFPDAGEAAGGGGGDTGGGTGGGDMGGGGGTTGGGTGGDDGGTGGGGGATGGGTGGGTVAGPEGAYIATLNPAQAVPTSASTESGSGTFTVAALTDGGYSLAWAVTHTINGGGITAGLKTGWAGFPGTAWFTLGALTGTRNLTPAEAGDVAAGRTFVSLVKTNEIRGQIIPAGNSLWTAKLNTTTPGATFGGSQFVVPLDGGAVSYVGAWTGDVVAELAHIHQGGAAGSGSPIVPLSITADAGGFSGSFDRATLTAGDTDGGLYVNVHTADAGSGLIRGQLVKH